MSPRIPAELARLHQAVANLETLIGDFTETQGKRGFVATDSGTDAKDIARRVDRVIDRLETVLGE